MIQTGLITGALFATLWSIIYSNQPDTFYVEIFQGGTCKTGHNDIILWGVSYSRCVTECLARLDVCASVTYHRTTGNCRIHASTVTLSPGPNCIGYIFSEKTQWKKASLTGCDPGVCDPGQRCASGVSSQCAYQECQGLPSPQNGQLYGNVATLHGKLLVRCDADHVMTGSSRITCMANGSWDNTSPICVPTTQVTTTAQTSAQPSTSPVTATQSTTTPSSTTPPSTSPVTTTQSTTTVTATPSTTTQSSTTPPSTSPVTTTPSTTTPPSTIPCDVINCQAGFLGVTSCQATAAITTVSVRDQISLIPCVHGITYSYGGDLISAWAGCKADFYVCY